MHQFRAVAKTPNAPSYKHARGTYRLFSRNVRKTFDYYVCISHETYHAVRRDLNCRKIYECETRNGHDS